jgi:hypothetical protein
MIIIKAEYLDESDIGIKVHSKFLSQCDASSVFSLLKEEAVSKDSAPFFIDLYDQESSTLLETIGISAETYQRFTGETVMSSEYYRREADFNQDLIFGALEQGLIDYGITMPWKEHDSLGLSAKKLQNFRRSDHVLLNIDVDDMEITPHVS